MAKQNVLKQEARNIKSRPEARTDNKVRSVRDDSSPIRRLLRQIWIA